MTFYNPFKWHIVKSSDKYFVRRLSLFGWWNYMDSEGYVWPRSRKWKWCQLDSVLEAVDLIEMTREERLI